MLRVTGDAVTWNTLLSIELIQGLKGGINLYEVNTEEAQVALCWPVEPSGAAEAAGETNTHLSHLLTPILCMSFLLSALVAAPTTTTPAHPSEAQCLSSMSSVPHSDLSTDPMWVAYLFIFFYKRRAGSSSPDLMMSC